jgi:hypothetical protein
VDLCLQLLRAAQQRASGHEQSCGAAERPRARARLLWRVLGRRVGAEENGGKGHYSIRPSLSDADGHGQCGGVRLWACRGVRLRRDEVAPAVRGPVGLAIA